MPSAKDKKDAQAKVVMFDPDAPDHRHGTESGYQTLKCRCDNCRLAHNVYTRLRRQKLKGTLQPGDHRHGTTQAYNDYGCRCDLCVEGRSTYYQAWKASRKK